MYSRNGLGKPFLYSEETLKILPFLIESFPNPSSATASRHQKNTYLILGLSGATIALVSILAFFLPRYAKAVWPLASANADTQTVFVHDASMNLLQAALHPDPNPSKGIQYLAFSEDSALLPVSDPSDSLWTSASPSVASADTATDHTTAGGSISVYTVQAGDSLSEIAQKNGITVNTILWANNIKSASSIKTGDKLVILPVSGVQHTVKAGETLAGIAKTFGADASDIASFNGLAEGAGLTAGDTIIIPGGELTSTSGSASSAKPASTKATSTKTSSSSTKIKTGGSLAFVKANPYKGGSGALLAGYYGNPVPGAILTQGIHGWNGVDLGAPAGTPIYAAAAGTVIVSQVGGWNGGYGNYVVIDHGNGTQTLYAHLSTDGVSVGETVTKGERIGGVGRTGEATGNHLHFEVRGAENPFADCEEMTHCSPE